MGINFMITARRWSKGNWCMARLEGTLFYQLYLFQKSTALPHFSRSAIFDQGKAP